MPSLFNKEKLLEFISILVLLLYLTGFLFGILDKDFEVENEIVALFILGVSAFAVGKIVTAVRLPALLGMLMVGILFRNWSILSFYRNIPVRWSQAIRDCALSIILIKAGLGLDPVKLSRLKLTVLKLSLIPCMVEAAAITVLSKYFIGLPWLWSLMLGFILCAVSAAVLVPGMIDLDSRNLGTEKGISTLMLASVSIDNTLALAGFFISLSIITSKEISISSLEEKLMEPFMGVLLGGAAGILMWWIPAKTANWLQARTLFLCLGGLNFVFLSKVLDIGGAGALGCISYTFTASLKWRQDTVEFRRVVDVIGILWTVLEVFLFGLIGMQVSIENLKQNIGNNVLILFLGLLFRFASTLVALCGTTFNLKEKTFISLSWISKATVQAAVGSIALEYMTAHEQMKEVRYGQQILSLSVLSIVLTAPLGAFIIDLLGPRLLNKENDENQCLNQVPVSNYSTL